MSLPLARMRISPSLALSSAKGATDQPISSCPDIAWVSVAAASPVETYFSVTPAGSVASGLPVYNADGGWKSWRLSLFGAHTLTGDLRHPGLSLFGVASYYRLKGDFSRSPIVSIAGDPNQYFAAIGLAYTF